MFKSNWHFSNNYTEKLSRIARGDQAASRQEYSHSSSSSPAPWDSRASVAESTGSGREHASRPQRSLDATAPNPWARSTTGSIEQPAMISHTRNDSVANSGESSDTQNSCTRKH